MNVSGPVETAFMRGAGVSRDTDNRQVYVVVGELRRLKIDVAGLHETRFGQAIYFVGDSIVLLFRRPLPTDEGTF